MDEAFELLKRFTEQESEAEKESRLSRAREEAGFALLLAGRFAEAFTLLAQSKVDPREPLALFPDLRVPDTTYSVQNAYFARQMTETRDFENLGAWLFSAALS